MTEQATKPRRYATLPNCDRCGRFTSTPTLKRGCVHMGRVICCYELLLCPSCCERTADQLDA